MGDAEVTSRSGSELQMSPPMEATSPSEVKEGERPKCRGHGCGRGTGRGHTASSSAHPGPKRSINKSRGQGKPPKAIQHNTILSWLHQPMSQEYGGTEVTYASEEAPRIASAQNHGLQIPSAPPTLTSNLPQLLHPMGTTCLTQVVSSTM